jgi:pyrroline-5-carboxylate reductase
MDNSKIGFLGCGKLGKSILRGLKTQGDSALNDLAISVTRESSRLEIGNEFGVHCEINNNKVVSESKLIILAMKPHQIQQALKSLIPDQQPRTWVSLAAGMSLSTLEQLLPANDRVFRAMPNSSAAFCSSMTLLFGATGTDTRVENFFRQVGETLWLRSETLIDTLTPLTASSPAFFYLLCEGFEDYLKTTDLSSEERSKIIGQTIQGVGRKIMQDQRPFSELLSEVATPGGMTLEGLRTLNEYETRQAFHQALVSAFEKSKHLAKGPR